MFDLLSRLVDKSLVVADERGDEMRYRLFETVRTYARTKLRSTEDGEDTAARHASFYLRLAEEAAAEMRGPAEAAWLRRLEGDHDNLRGLHRMGLGRRRGRYGFAVLLGSDDLLGSARLRPGRAAAHRAGVADRRRN